jgi:hypothetical protein
MMSVQITTRPDLRLGTPRLLFSGPEYRSSGVYEANFDVAPDGRFLMIQDDTHPPTDLSFVLNWFDDKIRSSRN